MQSGLYKADNISEDERLLSDGLVSIIENDYILNFLNDIDSMPKRYANKFRKCLNRNITLDLFLHINSFNQMSQICSQILLLY